MNKLETLYKSIKGLQDLGLPLNEETMKAADELEEQLIKTEILPAMSKDIEPRLSQIQRELVLVVEYKPGEPISVALSRKTNITKMLNAKTLTETGSSPVRSEETAKPIEPHEPTKHIENTTKGLRVEFPDGTVIWRHAAINTFIETLRKIGLERVARVGIKHGGYDLVSKEKRPVVPGRIWQHESDGWYVYSNISNSTKVEDLKTLSRHFNLGLKITEIRPHEKQ